MTINVLDAGLADALQISRAQGKMWSAVSGLLYAHPRRVEVCRKPSRVNSI